MNRKTTIILFLLISSGVFACINEYRTLLTGEVVHKERSSGLVWTRDIDTQKLKEISNHLLQSYERSDSIEYFSDYAATLIYLGEYQKAKKIYQEIEQKSPNLYTTASNLGTIYELINKPDTALAWIKKSVTLNPNSHGGSEWIHIKILEYKISKSDDFSTSILGLDFGDNPSPMNPHAYELRKLEEDIKHQLKERLTFIKPPNKIIGALYFDLGNIIAQTKDVQAAMESYHEAKKYGFESELLVQRIVTMQELANKAKPYKQQKQLIDFIKNHIVLLFSLVALTVFLLIVLFILFRKRRTV
ncbi:hypothetical protein GCM10022393_22640 [Aquimarina addita]|uniref:Tetratricopeptide repeat protein n=1 Tax=Aquimarina addita TaxID=870485 RepID=A0ABP6UK10_9FLAO